MRGLSSPHQPRARWNRQAQSRSLDRTGSGDGSNKAVRPTESDTGSRRMAIRRRQGYGDRPGDGRRVRAAGTGFTRCRIPKTLTIDSQAEDLRIQAEDRVTTLHALLQKYPSLKLSQGCRLEGQQRHREGHEAAPREVHGDTEGIPERPLQTDSRFLPSGTSVYRVRHEDMPERSEYTESDPQLWGPKRRTARSRKTTDLRRKPALHLDELADGGRRSRGRPPPDVQTDRVRGKTGSATAADRPAPLRGTAGRGQRPRAMA